MLLSGAIRSRLIFRHKTAIFPQKKIFCWRIIKKKWECFGFLANRELSPLKSQFLKNEKCFKVIALSIKLRHQKSQRYTKLHCRLSRFYRRSSLRLYCLFVLLIFLKSSQLSQIVRRNAHNALEKHNLLHRPQAASSINQSHAIESFDIAQFVCRLTDGRSLCWRSRMNELVRPFCRWGQWSCGANQ